jgi:hypothetical protein
MENPQIDMKVEEAVLAETFDKIYPNLKEVKDMTDEELLDQRTTMNAHSDELMKQSKERVYKINVGTFGMANDLYNLLSETSDWTVSDAAVFVSMMNDLKENKKKMDKDGNIQIRTANITSLYQYLVKMKGKGYNNALKFLQVLSVVGGSVSEAVKQIHDDNQLLKDVHTRLSSIDDEMDRRKVEGNEPQADQDPTDIA